MRFRGSLAAALATLIVLAPALAVPALASSAAPKAAASATNAVVAAPKVVIVVGAVQGSTASYRAKGDQIYAEAIKYTPNVVKLYSPNATWAQVKAAAQGASLFVYLGHGYGFPSPYREILSGSVQDGIGINGTGGVNDSDLKYYGETVIGTDIRFAKNAVVILSGLCYAAGSSENGDPAPSINVARQRIDNFASGFIKAGARVVIADTWVSSVIADVQAMFTTDQTFEGLWTSAPNYHSSEQPFIPVRNPQYSARVDPESGFYRSFVGAMDMRTTDFVAGAGAASTLAAPDSVDPELWSVDGPRDLTPNFDGDADRLNLIARYAESVTWTAALKNADGDVLKTLTGTGHQALIGWDLRIGGVLVPDGDYTWNLAATDAAGNAAADESGPFTVTSQPTPDTGVLSFALTTPAMIKSGTIRYALKFATPVTGLAASDITRTGSATKCVVGAPVGSGTDYTIAITGCATGTVSLYLNAGAVVDASLHSGPAGPALTSRVTIDTSVPKVGTVKPSLLTGRALEGASTSQRLLSRFYWAGTDTGSGIANYDVQRSIDGGAWGTIASGTTATVMNWTMTPGHTYRFRVRARDYAGNVGSYATTSTWHPVLTQNTSTLVHYTGAWATSSNAAHSGGSVRSSSVAGATASYTFTGRAVGWVTALRPDAGEVQVWVDGALISTVDTYAAATTYRQIVFSRNWSSYGTHTIKLVVVGTAGRPRADLDAFEVIR